MRSDDIDPGLEHALDTLSMEIRNADEADALRRLLPAVREQIKVTWKEATDEAKLEREQLDAFTYPEQEQCTILSGRSREHERRSIQGLLDTRTHRRCWIGAGGASEVYRHSWTPVPGIVSPPETTVEAPLDPRLDLANHSPTGLAWGYLGSGPAQLALAILCDATGDDELALAYYQLFKADIIAGFPSEQPFELHEDQIRAWLAAQPRVAPNDRIAKYLAETQDVGEGSTWNA